jgi:DNA-binding MarR family transcriptional regulator
MLTPATLGAACVRAGKADPDFTVRQLAFLMAVHANGNLSVGDYAGHIETTKPVVTRCAQKAVDAGWVTRVQSVHDRRTVHINLTKKGNALLQQIVGPDAASF